MRVCRYVDTKSKPIFPVDFYIQEYFSSYHFVWSSVSATISLDHVASSLHTEYERKSTASFLADFAIFAHRSFVPHRFVVSSWRTNFPLTQRVRVHFFTPNSETVLLQQRNQYVDVQIDKIPWLSAQPQSPFSRFNVRKRRMASVISWWSGLKEVVSLKSLSNANK